VKKISDVGADAEIMELPRVDPYTHKTILVVGLSR
jgi:hypothetical protein